MTVRDHYTSSTLFGGKGGGGPSSLCTTLEGPMEYVNARWMWSIHGILHGIKWIMFLDHLDYFQKPPLGGRPNTEPGDHGTLNAHNRWFILFYHVRGSTWIEIHKNCMGLRARSHMTFHYTWGSVTTLRDLEVSWDNIWTLCFGLLQFHNHGSWLMCEVAISYGYLKHMLLIF